MNKVIFLFVSIIMIMSLVACSIQGPNGLRQELRDDDQANEQFPGDNHVIEWSDSAFEEFIRIGLNKPTGDITVGEINHIYGIIKSRI